METVLRKTSLLCVIDVIVSAIGCCSATVKDLIRDASLNPDNGISTYTIRLAITVDLRNMLDSINWQLCVNKDYASQACYWIKITAIPCILCLLTGNYQDWLALTGSDSVPPHPSRVPASWE
jgi:hypothetical protein